MWSATGSRSESSQHTCQQQFFLRRRKEQKKAHFYTSRDFENANSCPSLQPIQSNPIQSNPIQSKTMTMAISMLQQFVGDMLQCGSTAQVFVEEEELIRVAPARLKRVSTESTDPTTQSGDSSVYESLGRHNTSTTMRSSRGCVAAAAPFFCGACFSSSTTAAALLEEEEQLPPNTIFFVQEERASSDSQRQEPPPGHPSWDDINIDDSYRYVIRLSPDKSRLQRYAFFDRKGGCDQHPELSLRRTFSDSLSELPHVPSSQVLRMDDE